MAPTPKGRQWHDGFLPSLDVGIQKLDGARGVCGIQPAKDAFSKASALLATIKDITVNKQAYVELGMSCAGVCGILDRGLCGRQQDELSQPVLEAINQLTSTVATIQKKVLKQGERNVAAQILSAKADKDMIAGWKREFDRMLQIFHTELIVDAHKMASHANRRNGLASVEGIDVQSQPPLVRVPKGEAAPPPPKACFGRDELINQIIDLAENFESVALIGAGGIGKTSVALSVLHHERIKSHFGDNRLFIRCDKFPASRAHLLRRLSEVIGAGIDNPKDLDSLRPFLSTKKMILFLDNAEPLFDPRGEDFKGIYSVVEELYRFRNICLGITSRISIVPSHFRRPVIPALSVESACKIFHEIYGHHGQSNIVNDIVRELDFHALSITLLATTASHNMWDYDRLAKEWKTHRTQILRTDYDQSLAAVIDLSLNSPTFKGLGPDARDLLTVIAFFPQGVDEENLQWLFPTISERKDIIDRFCVLSLTYRSNRFITMLAPIRDHLYPQDPKSSPLLWATKDRYFTRLSVFLDPDMPEFREARWIATEDVNVEHLLNALTPAGQDSHDVWDVCVHFMRHLYWHKPRQTVLRSKIEGVPDSHPSKSECLFQLARLSQSVGNRLEQKELLTRALALERGREDEPQVAQTLRYLSDVNRMLGLREEGIEQAKEALEIYERLDDKAGQTNCLNNLAWLLLSDKQLGAAKDAASRTIDLVRGGGQEFIACESHRVLGDVYNSEGEREKSVEHFKEALGIASRSGWHVQQFWIHYSLAGLYLGEKKFGEAHTHIAEAKSHTMEDIYRMGRAMELDARIWCRQYELAKAEAEVLGALEIFEGLGAAGDVENCMRLRGRIEREEKRWSTGFRRAWYTLQHRGEDSSGEF